MSDMFVEFSALCQDFMFVFLLPEQNTDLLSQADQTIR